ncbi:MAG: RNA polymerase sporulation sigma factor SigH [Clostridia bacterium]|nr:RNA polymerase sporulation sigma factor SigH [Clostridia bacterium]
MTQTHQLNNPYGDMPDEKVIEVIQSGDNMALNYMMNKYNDLVNMKASKFFMAGAERDDMIQEGLIGLYKATKSFNAEKQNSFKTFANLCIERQLITALKTSNRQKNIPLNSAFSLNSAAYEENDDVPVIDILDTKTVEDPAEMLTKKEYYNSIQNKIEESLSDFEKQVLHYYKQGKSYASIAEKLGAKVKSVDTAIQRIRKKANKIKQNMEQE